LAYVLHYTHRGRWLTPISRIAISIVPGITLLLVLTNEAHGLIWREVWLDTSGPYAVKQVINGPALWAFAAYAYALLLVGVLFLVRGLVRSGRIVRWQATALLVAVMIPWLLHFLEHLLGWATLGDLALTPIALGVTVPVIAWSLYRLQPWDIVPVAREAVINSIDDIIVVLNSDERIVDLNRAAQALVGRPLSDLLGKRVDELWPEYPNWMAIVPEEGSLDRQIKLNLDCGQRTFSLRLSSVTDRRGQTIGHVVALHDISELQRQTDVLATVLEATKAVSSSLDLDQVLGLIAEEMLNAAGADGCTLSRWDREQDAVVTWIEERRIFAEWADKPNTVYPLHRFPLTRRVLETREPQVVRLSDPDSDPTEVALLQSLETQTLLMLPLAYRDHVIGLAELDSERDRQFTPDEIRLCQLLADQAAVAIEHARLYQESRRREEELSTLLTSGMAITASLELEDILTAVAEAAVFLLKATGAHVCRWDGTQRTMTVIAEALDTAAPAREGVSHLGATYAEQPLVGHLLENRQPYPLRLSDPDLPEDWRHYLNEHGGKSALILPLVHEEETAIYL
jgi:PAS domain S-box-containing protein